MKKLSDANYEIMKLIWEKEELSVNEVLEALNSKRAKKLKRTTVQTQLHRLEKYGWLISRKNKREFLYSTLQPREKANARVIRNIRKSLFENSHFEMVKCLFSESEISTSELEKIEKFLAQVKKREP
ncbi:MAG: BlaI/MecI/CopY family transcriptional regulator [Candidatus Aminicenantes bacterium]|nr:BlaI/MecI/CopY family transcriptional regulator [Candidatus Aminicenantes bacterium]